MRLIWLEPDTPFPDPEQALQEPAGLLAAGLIYRLGACAPPTAKASSPGSPTTSHRCGGLLTHAWFYSVARCTCLTL